jgi:hypothetical protein
MIIENESQVRKPDTISLNYYETMTQLLLRKVDIQNTVIDELSSKINEINGKIRV